MSHVDPPKKDTDLIDSREFEADYSGWTTGRYVDRDEKSISISQLFRRVAYLFALLVVLCWLLLVYVEKIKL